MTRRYAAALAALLVATNAACTATPEREARGPRLVPVDCPSEVEIQVVPRHSCGYVETTGGSGTSHRLFVVRIEPPRPTTLAPVLETGTDLGMAPGYAGLAPIAQRTGRSVVIVDLPGTGRSTPSLDCPEVRDVPPTREAAGRDLLVEAVTDCRDRLRSTGVDPAAASPPEMGSLLRDVMVAHGEPAWVVMGHGTSALAAVEVARGHPGLVEAVVLDSMVHDDRAPLATMQAVVAGVARECRRQRVCLRRYGDPQAAWRRASQALRDRPLALPAGERTLVLDDAELLRAARWLVAPDALGPEWLPQLLAEAVAGGGSLLERYAVSRVAGPAHCVGYLPKCDGGALAFGAVLSSLCPDVASLPDWRASCRAWGVGPRRGEPEPLLGVPVLAVHGRYDPFASPRAVRDRLALEAPDAFVMEAPTSGHNVLADACVREVRNAWLADADHRPPERPDCLSDRIRFS